MIKIFLQDTYKEVESDFSKDKIRIFMEIIQLSFPYTD